MYDMILIRQKCKTIKRKTMPRKYSYLKNN